MNLLLTNTLLLILYIGSFSDFCPSRNPNEIETPKAEGTLNVSDELYDLQFKIETTEDNKHNLIIDIKLHNRSHFISPKAKQYFTGKFFMDLGDYTYVEFEGNMTETPKSVEEFDPHPFVNGYVNWVRVNTTYKQPLKLNSQNDFEVFGRVRFTIEPRCTLEEIPFSISYKAGKMKLQKAKC